MLRQPLEQNDDHNNNYYKEKYFKELEEHSALKSEHIAALNELSELREFQKKLAGDPEDAAEVKVG